MNYITNELSIAKEIIEHNVYRHGYAASFSCLSKYFRSIGFSKTDTSKKIHEVFTRNSVIIDEPYFIKMLNDIIDYVYDNNKNIVNVQSVPITKMEWETILSLENEDLERLAYVMLVDVKLHSLVKERDISWFNGSLYDAYKFAGLSGKYKTVIDRGKFAHELVCIGMITPYKKETSVSLRVNYKNDDSDILFEIRDFNNIMYYFKKQKGYNVSLCGECGKTFKKKKSDGNNTKYCSEKCKQNAKRRKSRDRKRKSREKSVQKQ